MKNLKIRSSAKNEESSSESEEPPEKTQEADPLGQLSSILALQEDEDMLIPNKEPQLYLCDDRIQPVEVVCKPKKLHAKDKARAKVVKNCLICYPYVAQRRMRFYH